MKKLILLIAVSLLFPKNCIAQTWTIDNDRNNNVQFKVITKEQFSNLLGQMESQNTGCEIDFKDVLEETNPEIINGVKPTFSGSYYLLGMFIPKTDNESQWFNKSTQSMSFIRYGNSETGKMTMYFFKDFDSGFDIAGNTVLLVEGDLYKIKYNEYLDCVNRNERK